MSGRSSPTLQLALKRRRGVDPAVLAGMASRTPRQRVDAEGFTLVSRRRRKPSAATEASSVPDYRRYLLAGQQGDTTFQAVKRLEQAHPGLRVRITERRGEIYLDPKTEETAFLLARLCREGNTRGLTLTEVDRRTRGIVMRYPLSYPLDPLRDLSCVTFVRRCVKRTGHGRSEPTRQVEVEFRRSFPNSLDLGIWGVYSVRRFVPEPLRCFKCQGFGHVQKHCARSELCGVCSQGHATSECIRALKAGHRPEAQCPNCGGRHHVWSPHCPERLRRLPPRAHGASRGAPRAATPTRRSLSTPQPSVAPVAPPSVPEAKKRRRRRRRTRPATQPASGKEAPVIANTPVEAATQTVPVIPEGVDASTQTTTEARTVIDWCWCDEDIVIANLNRINDIPKEMRIFGSTRDEIEHLCTRTKDMVLRLRAIMEQGMGPPCDRECYSDE